MILWQDIYSKIAYLFTGILITQLALYIWLLDYHNISIIEEPQAFIENEAGHKLKKKKKTGLVSEFSALVKQWL